MENPSTNNIYEILETRKKSYKLKAGDGTTFFIKKAWCRKDGTFTPAAQKSYQEAVDRQSFKKELIPLEPVWENEKVIGVDYTAEFTLDPTIGRTSARPKRVRAWLPKSQCKDGSWPRWLVETRVNAALNKANLHSGYTITGIW